MAEIPLESAPRKTRELFEKAASAMERGNYDYAIEMLMSILDREPRLLQVRKFLRSAQIRKFQDKKGGSLTHMLSSVSGFGKSMQAQGAIKKKPLQALQLAESLMNRDPLNPSFYNLLIKAAEAAEMPEVAVHTLEVIRELMPDDVDLLRELATLYKETGDTRGARECYEQVVALRPNDPTAMKSLKDSQAMETMQRGKWDEAKSYRDVMKDSDEAKRLEQQGKAVKTTKDIDTLIAETEERLAKEPDNFPVKRALADLYARALRYDEAIALLEQANEASGGGDPQIDRSLSRIRIERFDAQIAVLQEPGREQELQAVEKQKDDFIFSDAEERVRRYPNDLQFKYEFGVLLYERGQYTEALQQLQLAQRNPQRRIRALYYLARCFKAKGQLDIAAEQLERAASELTLMDEGKKEIVYELGCVLEEMGLHAKAIDSFKEIYAVDISFRDVAERMEKSYAQQRAGKA